VKISFCIITLNEAENLPRCLASCADLADEIVVLDSGSTDSTERIARQFGARWEVQGWPGYVAQKNKLLSFARNKWVFSIDADEELSPELRGEIRALKSSEPPEAVSGYSMPRCVFFEGRWIRHGNWYPDRLTRLFRKHRAQFAGGKVHERLNVTGKIVRLRGELHHYSFRDAEDHWKRCQKYAKLWAETRHEEGKSAGMLTPYVRATVRWLRGYFIKAGFLDGKQGLRIANVCAREVFLKYKLLREMCAQRSQPN
jgi:glycosyltransferase involved in cell wall biosynthesis